MFEKSKTDLDRCVHFKDTRQDYKRLNIDYVDDVQRGLMKTPIRYKNILYGNAVSPKRLSPSRRKSLLGKKNDDGLYQRLIKNCYRLSKPFFDICISSICLVFALPIILILGAIVKLTSQGPAFYTQVRVGKNGRLFRIIKLRTMSVDSEDKTGATWAKKNDARVTRFGRFLRKTHLDELPQLINVIKGDMSIIGPRPERPIFVKRFIKEIPGYTKRLSVKPGITGMAQCCHKYDESMQDVCRKLHYDMIYIERRCWLLDAKIVLLTAVVSLVWANGRS